MEQRVLNSCEPSVTTLQFLASIRSLITNSHTSNSTISSLLETLTSSLQLTPNSLIHHHTLKLLTDIARHRTHLCPAILNSVRSNSILATESFHVDAESHRMAADSLISLASISELDGNLVRPEIDNELFVSLCFGPSVTVRLWLLRNAEKVGVPAHVMLTVFLGFTKDPYPYVREAALDGLVRLCKYGSILEDCSVIEGCYCRAVELLQDNEDCVRLAAVRVASEWGQMLVVEANKEEDKREWSNVVFLQLCSMVRDMSVQVRAEAFNAVGRIKMVSRDVLLQTLSKKVLGNGKEKKSLGQRTAGRFEILALGAAGAFVHGLEDEYYEYDYDIASACLKVRKSACYSLRTLTVLCTEFADGVLNLLIDMLNDDSVVVRLEALETLHHMATFECLKVREMHMHMFLGSLLDSSAPIRSTSRKIFKLVKLHNLELFRLSINGLLENLELHPQDEVDVFSVLFHMGRTHGKFAAHFIQEVSQEIEPIYEGELGLDSTRVAAFLVLSISVPISRDWNGQCIPPRLFSYAVTSLGRISCALKDVVDQDTLLAYLSQCSRSSSSSVPEFEGKDSSVVNDDIPSCTGMDGISQVGMPFLQTGDESSVAGSLRSCESRDVATSLVEYEKEEDEVLKYMNLILEKAKDAWLLVQASRTNEALQALRFCKEEVVMFNPPSPESTGALAFTLQFIKVVKLLSKVWEHIMWKVRSSEMGELEILLGKVDRKLRELRSRFVGFSKEEELHVLELILVTYVVRLSKVEICCYLTTLKKFSATISHVEFLLKEGSIEPSDFVIEAKKTLQEVGISRGGSSYSPFLFRKLVDLFKLKQFNLCRVRHIDAKLDVLDNDFENPLPFVGGLPVAIPLEITMHNVASDNRLWLRIAVSDESAQFVFLDSNILGGCNEVKKFKFLAPFYRTPKVGSFTLSVCIGMECWFEDVHFVKGCGGPKHSLAYLCPEKEVYLRMVQNNL